MDYNYPPHLNLYILPCNELIRLTNQDKSIHSLQIMLVYPKCEEKRLVNNQILHRYYSSNYCTIVPPFALKKSK